MFEINRMKGKYTNCLRPEDRRGPEPVERDDCTRSKASPLNRFELGRTCVPLPVIRHLPRLLLLCAHTLCPILGSKVLKKFTAVQRKDERLFTFCTSLNVDSAFDTFAFRVAGRTGCPTTGHQCNEPRHWNWNNIQYLFRTFKHCKLEQCRRRSFERRRSKKKKKKNKAWVQITNIPLPSCMAFVLKRY